MAIKLYGQDRESTINQKTQLAEGTYYLADNPNLYEPQRGNHFDFIIDKSQFTSNVQKAGHENAANANDYFTPDNFQELLRLAVTKVSIPHFSQNAIEIKRGNNTINFAGTPKFSSGSLSVVDWIGADTVALLMAWQNLSYNVLTEKVGLASDYKKTCTLIEYTPDYQVVRKWNLYGCFITDLKEEDMDSDASDGKRLISVSFVYDKAIPQADE